MIQVRVGKAMFALQERSIGSEPNAITMGTTADIYGYGLANVVIGVSADHFRELALAMMAANPDEATKAFGHALKDGISEQRALKPLPRPDNAAELRAGVEHALRKKNDRLAARLKTGI